MFIRIIKPSPKKVHSVSVRKFDLFDALCKSGHSPPKSSDPEYENQAKEHLYQLLDISKEEASESTKDNVARAANLFHQRVIYHWKKSWFKMETMKKRPYFQENLVVEIVPLSLELGEWATRKPSAILVLLCWC